MFTSEQLSGSIECTRDSVDCVLDAESERQVMSVQGTGMQTLILRALKFKNGMTRYAGGGILITDDAIVEVVLCVFTNCECNSEATGHNEDHGGGAIAVYGSESKVNVYASR